MHSTCSGPRLFLCKGGLDRLGTTGGDGIAKLTHSGIVCRHMKTDIHPDNYRLVIFHDNSSNERFLIGSTIETTATDTWTDGKEYPISYVEVSSASHPFYTGTEKVMDTAGRVEKFKARAEQAAKRKKA